MLLAALDVMGTLTVTQGYLLILVGNAKDVVSWSYLAQCISIILCIKTPRLILCQVDRALQPRIISYQHLRNAPFSPRIMALTDHKQ